MSSILRTDLIDADLLEVPPSIKVEAEQYFISLIDHSVTEKTKSPQPVKDINEVGDLIIEAIQDKLLRTHKTQEAGVELIYEYPDRDLETETISLSFVSRVPGMYAQGSPMESRTQNRRPILREVADDPDNPGYKRAVFGFFYDNIVRLTSWAMTNKQANRRAVWLEDVLEEYSWFFAYNGVNRLLYEGWRTGEKINIGNNRYYGRPIDYFVRTEKLINVSQKTLEQIIVRTRTTTQ